MSAFASDALAGRTILITGASSGLGRAAALAVAAHGGRVVVSGRDAGRLEETLALLAGEGHITMTGPLDDADHAAALMADAAGQAGGLDGVFHSAGAELVLPMRLVKQKHLDQVFGAAVQGALGIARAAAKADVMKGDSSIVFMSSAAAHRGRPGMVAYSAAKAALEGLTRSLACELAPKTVRVNAITGGGIETEMHARLIRTLSDEAVASYAAQHLLGFGRPQDVADAVLFLLSPASRWITGTSLVVDGGYLAS
jgi:NAD(P)-dependent dehydrogenase (short-subunit alcohol dehydrogenase family)